MEVDIRLARKSYLSQYGKFLQEVYQDTYPNKETGLTRECFSEKIFSSPRIQTYLESNLLVNDKQKCWLAFIGDELAGSVSIIEREDDYELRGFYVASKHQRKGIGKKLLKFVLGFAKGKDITCDIYAHNVKTIETYKRWGFEIDTAKGVFYWSWPEWPEGVETKSIYMCYRVEK